MTEECRANNTLNISTTYIGYVLSGLLSSDQTACSTKPKSALLYPRSRSRPHRRLVARRAVHWPFSGQASSAPTRSVRGSRLRICYSFIFPQSRMIGELRQCADARLTAHLQTWLSKHHRRVAQAASRRSRQACQTDGRYCPAVRL